MSISLFTWIAISVIAGFLLGWSVGLHLPYYYRPAALLRKRYLIIRRKWLKRKLSKEEKKAFDFMVESGWGDQ